MGILSANVGKWTGSGYRREPIGFKNVRGNGVVAGFRIKKVFGSDDGGLIEEKRT